MDFFISQFINSLALGALLFMMAAGLSLIFGLMNVVNLAHGSFFMIGAYTAITIIHLTGSFWLALCIGWIPAAVVAFLVERVFIQTLYKAGHLKQVLLTFGFILVFGDACRFLWGTEILNLDPPAFLNSSLHAGSIVVPLYRFFVILFGAVTGFVLWWFLERSRLGAMIRAGVDDAATAAGIGINVSLLFSAIFTLGAALAAIGGIIASPIMGVYLGVDIDILIPAFIVIVVGGMGSLRGAFAGAMLVALIDTFGKALFPDYALFLIYLLMIGVLLIRPEGLFGTVKG